VILTGLALAGVALLVSSGITSIPPSASLLLAFMLAIFVVVFVRIEIGLYILLLSMLLSPEIIVSGKGTVAEGREIVLRVEDLLILIISFTWFAKTAVNKELGLFLRTPLNGAIAAYVVTHVIATLWGAVVGNLKLLSGFFYILKYVEYIFFYFMTINNVKDRRQTERLVATAFLTAAIVSLVAIGQIPSGQRVSAPFEGDVGEPNTLGGYLVFMMALALGCALETKMRQLRVAMCALLGLMFLPFLYTQSRDSYFAFLPTLLVFLVLSRRRLILTVALVVAVVVGSSLLPDVVVKRITRTFEPEAGQPQARIGRLAFDPSTSQRIQSTQDAVEAWSRSPLLGYGVTGFRFLDAQYARTLVETGAIGFVAFGFLLWSIWRTAWQSYHKLRDPSLRGLALGYLAGFIGMLFHGIGANTFIIVRIMEPFWFFTAIMVLLPQFEESVAHQPLPEDLYKIRR
jgi:O-antigen ligase